MKDTLNPSEIGSLLGSAGVANVVSTVEEYCAHAERTIELTNRPDVVGLRAEFSRLRAEEERLKALLEHAPPGGDLRENRRKGLYAWIVAVTLTCSGLFFALLSFEPFRLGWKGYVYCLGITIVLPFLLDRLLDSIGSPHLEKGLTAVAVSAGIASLMLLAVVRGDLLKHEVEEPPSIVIDGVPSQTDTATSFYTTATRPLEIATVLLSLAMELGAGLALREGWRRLRQPGAEWQELRRELARVNHRMISHAVQITQLEVAPRLFSAHLWRQFYGTMLTQTIRSAMTKLLVLTCTLALAFHASAGTLTRTDLVIAIDLSKSVSVRGPDGRTEFQKNVEAVTRILGEVPPGARITVIGITDRSFAQPYIVLSAELPQDAGYFGERLRAARGDLISVWAVRSAKLKPTADGTDITGAIRLAGELFRAGQSDPRRRVLVIFSDMRNTTPELNSNAMFRSQCSLPVRMSSMGDLSLAHVYALGVDGAGKSQKDWECLQQYWTERICESSGIIISFTVLRDLPFNALQ